MGTRFAFQFIGAPPGLEDINRKISVKNIQYARVNESTFHTVINSLFKGVPLDITYYSPHRSETTERSVFPLHLLSYMGSWHLIAFCALRRDLRNFSLSRVMSIEQCATPIELPDGLPTIKEYIRKNFGLFSGGRQVEVCIRFSPAVSDWIAEQVWHQDQRSSFEEDGSICLRFPVSDFREIKGEILKHGRHVEVVSPPELREEIQKEIAKMKRIYR